MAERRCAICGESAATSPVMDVAATDIAGNFSIRRCDSCGALHTAPVPDDLGPYYATEIAATMIDRGSSLFDHLKRRQMAREVRRLGGYTEATTILDVGCGTGDLAVVAARLGRDVLAADRTPTPPAAVAGAGIGYLQFDFEGCAIRTAHPGGPYCVVLRHVLEHARDPVHMLSRLREQGGEYFYIVVPNADCSERRAFGRYWYMWDPPRHLWHFDDATLDLACRRAGIAPIAGGRGTAPTLLPSFYRAMRLGGWPPGLYRPFGPNTTLTAMLSPLCLLFRGNVLWRIGRAR